MNFWDEQVLWIASHTDRPRYSVFALLWEWKLFRDAEKISHSCKKRLKSQERRHAIRFEKRLRKIVSETKTALRETQRTSPVILRQLRKDRRDFFVARDDPKRPVNICPDLWSELKKTKRWAENRGIK
jgi:hypothetical protein